MIKETSFNNTFQETLENINNKDILLNIYNNTGIADDEGYRLRYEKWLQFFNSFYNRIHLIYSDIIYAITFAFNNIRLITTQTQYEFETSVLFFETFIDAKLNIRKLSPDAALQLVAVSLVFGKYASLQFRPFKTALEFMNVAVLNHKDVSNFFCSLFIKYADKPKYLVDHLPLLSETEINMLWFVAKGNNIRNHPALPIPLSKKESYVFNNKLPEDLGFTNKIVLRGIIAAKILLQTDCTDLLYSFFENNNTFQNQPLLFYADIAYWSEAYRFLINQYKAHDEILSIERFVQHFEYMREVDKNYFLKRKTVYTVKNEIDDFLRDKRDAKKKSLISETWEKSRFDDISLAS